MEGKSEQKARTGLGLNNSSAHPDVQNVQLQPDVDLILSEDLDAVDMAEVGQQGH